MFDSAREANPASARVSHKKGKGVELQRKRAIVRRENAGVVEDKKQREVSRRHFLQAALATVAAGATSPKWGPKGLGVLRKLGSTRKAEATEVTFLPKAQSEILEVSAGEKAMDAVFGTDKDAARPKVEEMKARITSESDYKERIMAMPKKYEKYMREQARINGINGDLLMGLTGIENGGGEAIYGDNGLALGLYQFWEGTARDAGLVVNDEVDERADPYKSTEAAAGMIKDLKQMFGGNEGLAIWAHNVGTGRALRALQIYFNDTRHFNIGDYIEMTNRKDHKTANKIAKEAARLIVEDNVNVHKVLENTAAFDYLSAQLYKGFENYPYKVVAISQLLNEQV